MQKVRRGRKCGPEGDASTISGAVGSKLRSAREKVGMSLQEASDATGGLVSSGAIGQWEMGQSLPRLNHFLGLCMAYGMRPLKMLPQKVLNMLTGRKQQKEEILELLER